MRILVLLFFLPSFFLPSAALGYRYITPMEDSVWLTESSRFMCRLSHSIEAYGDGQFIHEAGERQYLLLDGDGYMFGKRKIGVVADAPPWRPTWIDRDLRPVRPTKGNMVIKGELAADILMELTRGMLVGFKGILDDTNEESFDVYLSSVGMKKPYEDYKRCQTNLLPANFAQLKRSRIQYDIDKFEISAPGRKLLDTLAEYLMEDDEVMQVFVDGHTDNTGTNKDNVTLSEKRAREVTNYLLAKGVSASKIVTRYHGEKYPVAKNSSVKNKTRNRRTTIRLSKKAPLDKTPMTKE